MKVVIVIDMQNDFIDGALGSKEAVAIVPAVKEKIAAARKSGVPVIYTRDTHTEDYLNTAEGRKLPVVHCVKGTEGWEISAELTPADGEHIIDKPSFGFDGWKGFFSENFSAAPDEIELCGLCTDICVVSNAMILKAAFPEAAMTVDAKATAGVSAETYEAALTTMATCQIDIVR